MIYLALPYVTAAAGLSGFTGSSGCKARDPFRQHIMTETSDRTYFLKLLAEGLSYSWRDLESEVSTQLLWGVLMASMSRFPSEMYDSKLGKVDRCSHTTLSRAEEDMEYVLQFDGVSLLIKGRGR